MNDSALVRGPNVFRLARVITDDEIRTFEKDGVVHLPGIVDRDLVAHLQSLADADLATPTEMQQEWSVEGDTGRFFSDTFMWPRNDEFRDVIFNSPLGEIGGVVMGARHACVIFDQFLIKEPNTVTPTYWHQDTPYWPVEGRQICTVWLALDHVTPETGAVEYVRGSHLWGQQFRPIAFKPGVAYATDLPEVPDIEGDREHYDIVQYTLRPGDCTVHDGLTLHGGPGNRSRTERRRAYITRWAGEDVRYRPKPDIKPMLYDPGIPAGAQLECALFAKVWRRED